MRRYRYLISLLVLVASLAQQGPVAAQAVVPAHPSFGKRTADPRNFGAKIDGTTDDSLAFQRAIDSLIDTGQAIPANNTTYGRLLVPSGKTALKCPLWLDVSNIEIWGEGHASVLLCGDQAGPALAGVLWGIKRDTNWTEASGDVVPSWSQLPSKFDAPGVAANKLHRVTTTGLLDATASGRWAIRSRPIANGDGTYVNPVPPDHHVSFWNNPLAQGAGDCYRDQQKICIASAFAYPPGGTIPAGTMFYGHGNGQDGGSQLGPFALFMAPGALQGDPPRYCFKFHTQETGDFDRIFYFGDSTIAGLHQIVVQLDFTANSTAGTDAGLCKIYVSQRQADGSFKQIPVTRGSGTMSALSYQHVIIGNSTGGTYTVTMINPVTHKSAVVTIASTDTAASLQTQMDSLFGAGNTVVTVAGFLWNNWIVQFQGALIGANVPLFTIDTTNTTGTNVSPGLTSDCGFSAAQNLHFQQNDFFFFSLFGDPVNRYLSTHRPISDLICAGLSISNQWIYADHGTSGSGVPAVETRIDAGAINDGNRYFDNFAGTNPGLLGALGLDDPPNDATKTSNKFVHVYHGQAGGGSQSYGLFLPFDITQHDLFNTVTKTAMRNLRMDAQGTWGACVMALGPLHQNVSDCQFFSGWTGFDISNSYDWIFSGDVDFVGSHAWLSVIHGAVDMHTITREPIGHYGIFLSGSNCNVKHIYVADMSYQGRHTHSLVRQDAHGTYGNRIKIDNIETDNEFAMDLSQFNALVDVDLVNTAINPAIVDLKGVASGGINDKPILQLNGGAGAVGDAINSGSARVADITMVDRTLVSVDGPNWQVYYKETDQTWWQRDPILYVNPLASQPPRVEYQNYPFVFPADPNATPPVAGRWRAGTQRVFVWNPAAGAVAEWRVTQSGTGAWSSTYKYFHGALVQRSGVEYECIIDAALNIDPATDTLHATWQPTTDGYGFTTAPVFKAVSTVAP